MIGAFGLTAKRNRLIDYPYRTADMSLRLMIPKPVKNPKMNYINAVWKPFQPQVTDHI